MEPAMTVYKRCPFCDALFEIGPEDDEPMRRHLRAAHVDDTVGACRGDGAETVPPLSAYSFEDGRAELRGSRDG